VYHWLNYEFGSLNFFWCGFVGSACFKIVFCWGWLFEARLLDRGWDGVVIVVFRVLSLNDSWLLVFSGVRRGRTAAGVGAAVIVLVAMEFVVELVLDLLLQMVESSALILLMLLLGIVHLGAGLGGVCLEFFALVLGNGVNVGFDDMLLSGFYNRVFLSRRVCVWENRKSERNSSVKVQVEGLQREGLPIESFLQTIRCFERESVVIVIFTLQREPKKRWEEGI
jgi:hypothetical protein